ncbi:hypothetical protein [Guangdong red-banded snake torovirus]|uniref:Uncharacterized protein n=1 Tax=Guangdong red-banded snake-Lycodon rufozonatus-torovirus LPSF30546 TaxID=2847099 RepID=A0A2P1GN02_9NIDO|nr:hypothetical protein [Guangdong red-banded snake torovirus]AVM87348.1 hypothetical protein [Guangdong red-banded snake-Lycodon rufozonatus-torovirus LPSF30546]
MLFMLSPLTIFLFVPIVVSTMATNSTPTATTSAVTPCPTTLQVQPPSVTLVNCTCTVGLCAIDKTSVSQVFGAMYEKNGMYYFGVSVVVVASNFTLNSTCHSGIVEKSDVYTIPINDSCQLQIPGQFFKYTGDNPTFTSQPISLCPTTAQIQNPLPVVNVTPVIEGFLDKQVKCQNFSYLAQAIAKGPGGGDIFLISIATMLLVLGMLLFWCCCLPQKTKKSTNKYY